MKALDSRGHYDLPCSIKWTSGDGVTNYSHFNDVTNSFYCVIVFLKEERNYPQFIYVLYAPNLEKQRVGTLGISAIWA